MFQPFSREPCAVFSSVRRAARRRCRAAVPPCRRRRARRRCCACCRTPPAATRRSRSSRANLFLRSACSFDLLPQVLVNVNSQSSPLTLFQPFSREPFSRSLSSVRRAARRRCRAAVPPPTCSPPLLRVLPHAARSCSCGWPHAARGRSVRRRRRSARTASVEQGRTGSSRELVLAIELDDRRELAVAKRRGANAAASAEEGEQISQRAERRAQKCQHRTRAP